MITKRGRPRLNWGIVIKSARNKSGITQMQLASLLKTNQGNVSRWENGDKPRSQYRGKLRLLQELLA